MLHYLSDTPVPALHPAGPLVDGGQVSVHVAGEAAAARHLVVRCFIGGFESVSSIGSVTGVSGYICLLEVSVVSVVSGDRVLLIMTVSVVSEVTGDIRVLTVSVSVVSVVSGEFYSS